MAGRLDVRRVDSKAESWADKMAGSMEDKTDVRKVAGRGAMKVRVRVALLAVQRVLSRVVQMVLWRDRKRVGERVLSKDQRRAAATAED